jgi:translation elongation factor EF-1alpha
MAEEKLIGKVTHFFNKIGVAVLTLTEDSLKVGEKIHFKGGERDFEQTVTSMQVDHKDIAEAKKGDDVGFKADALLKEGDEVYKVLE